MQQLHIFRSRTTCFLSVAPISGRRQQARRRTPSQSEGWCGRSRGAGCRPPPLLVRDAANADAGNAGGYGRKALGPAHSCHPPELLDPRHLLDMELNLMLDMLAYLLWLAGVEQDLRGRRSEVTALGPRERERAPLAEDRGRGDDRRSVVSALSESALLALLHDRVALRASARAKDIARDLAARVLLAHGSDRGLKRAQSRGARGRLSLSGQVQLGKNRELIRLAVLALAVSHSVIASVIERRVFARKTQASFEAFVAIALEAIGRQPNFAVVVAGAGGTRVQTEAGGVRALSGEIAAIHRREFLIHRRDERVIHG